jgi:hypothetical protein
MNIIPWDKNAFNGMSFDEIDTAINEILKVDISAYSIEDMHQLFFKHFSKLPITVKYFPTKGFKDLKLYRARPCEGVEDNEINSIDTYAGPPWNEDRGIGRANWRERNVFYGSDTPYAALMEAKEVYIEKEFFIAKWGFDYEKFKTEHIQVSTLILDNIPRDNPWFEILNWSRMDVAKLQSEIGVNAAEKYIYLFKKISKLFVDLDKSKYKITAYLADQRIYFAQNTRSELYFPLLIYPSVETKNMHCNFAIHPFFVKQYMRLETVFHVKLKEITSGFKHGIEKIGLRSGNNEIEWYSLYLDSSKSSYCIQSFSCYPSDKNPDLDKIVFKKNNQIISHGEIILQILEERNYSDFYELDNILVEDGLPAVMEVKFPLLSINNITVTIEGIEYKDITMDVTVYQAYGYEKVSEVLV